MKNVSLKLDDSVFTETEAMLVKVKKNRNRYINEAVAFYNQLQQRVFLSNTLIAESRLVREESMRILNEMEAMDSED